MGKFDGILICTDLDGTLLKNDKSISAENKEAIEYFKSEGGYFTFVTGRMAFYSEDSYHAVNPNAPVGCVNGGGVYDYEKDEYVWQCELPKHANEIIDDVEREFPEIGIQINTFHKAYFCKDNESMIRFRRVTGLPNLKMHYRDIEETFAKVIFGSDLPEEIISLDKFLKSHHLADDFDFIHSERSLYEILPKGIGKGMAVKKLAEYLGIDNSKTVAIGDYNNDISMFDAAGVSIAVSNASPDALRAAKYITVSNEEHAIARVIADIENGKYGL